MKRMRIQGAVIAAAVFGFAAFAGTRPAAAQTRFSIGVNIGQGSGYYAAPAAPAYVAPQYQYYDGGYDYSYRHDWDRDDHRRYDRDRDDHRRHDRDYDRGRDYGREYRR